MVEISKAESGLLEVAGRLPQQVIAEVLQVTGLSLSYPLDPIVSEYLGACGIVPGNCEFSIRRFRGPFRDARYVAPISLTVSNEYAGALRSDPSPARDEALLTARSHRLHLTLVQSFFQRPSKRERLTVFLKPDRPVLAVSDAALAHYHRQAPQGGGQADTMDLEAIQSSMPGQVTPLNEAECQLLTAALGKIEAWPWYVTPALRARSRLDAWR